MPYDFELLTFGGTPPIRIEIPKPFIPDWAKWALGLLSLGFVAVVAWLVIRSNQTIAKPKKQEEKASENAIVIKNLRSENAEQAIRIAYPNVAKVVI